MTEALKPPKFIGEPIKRREDPRLIQGLGRYVDDLAPPGCLHVGIVRSTHAHARLKSVDASAALALPGVVAVFTGEDTKDVGPVPVAALTEDTKVPHHPILARGTVRYVGEPIAAVVADGRYAARDGADRVSVDYDPLPAVVDPEKALEAGAAKIHEDFDDNLAFTWGLGDDVGAELEKSDRVIRQRMVHGRVIPCPMETRGALADYDRGRETLTLSSSTQIPHILKTQVALQMGIPEHKVRVITPEVGGGFGCKLNVYREEGIVSFVSRALGKPAKWIESRSENFLATIHGRGQVGEVEVGVMNDGTLTALRYSVTVDVGAYHQLLTPGIVWFTGFMMAGPYKLPHLEVKVRGAFTNKMATDAYRGAGRPEATLMVERIMDIAAREMGMDPVELRRKNFPDSVAFPFTAPSTLVYDSGNYAPTMDKALKAAGYDDLRKEQAEARKAGQFLGIGVSSYVEICGMGPSSDLPSGGWESATIRVQPTGKITVLTGTSPHGQGQETTFAQIVAEGFGVPMEDVTVIHGDTDTVQYGIGTFGSRATAVGGAAVWIARDMVIEKAKKFAAVHLEADPADVILEAGEFYVRGNPEKRVPLLMVALGAYHPGLAGGVAFPEGETPGLEATHYFEPSNFTFPFGTHVCVVEVDPETGDVKVLRYLGVDDVGNVINPLLVDGQIHGGIAQGLGQALDEEFFYDENGQPLNGSFMHYALPKATDFPRFELDRTTTTTPVNPLGAKGVGEAGTIASTPAVVNAVVDALSPWGVTHMDIPIRPEKVWRITKGARP
ncbi:MAG: xanthine dehydrogenase family protein molybdopterin-binding subunit [Nitrospinota bacterium]|nr:xanthine dehydrogenase family protein molybdopterin-binding subunit [Nitrospinota bacterium]